MKKQVKAILNYKDSCNMYVINSYRKKKQYALSFDGVDDYVDMGNVLNMGLSDFTIEAKIKTNQSTIGMIASKGINSSFIDSRYALYINNGKLSGFFSSDTDFDIQGTSLINNNTYKNICTVYNRDELMSIYVDGVLESSISIASEENFDMISSLDFLLGAYNRDVGGQTNFYDGLISDVKIWNTARTQQQIQDNLNIKLTGNEPGLAAYYDFSSGSGTTLFDKTANGNHGTISGATWVEL